MSPVGVAVLAAVATWWWTAAPTTLARLSSAPEAKPTPVRSARWALWAVACATFVIATGVAFGPPGAACAMAIAQVVAAGVWLVSRRRLRARAVTRRSQVVHAGELIAGLLRVGRVPTVALTEASVDAPVLAVAAAELAAGGEASAALRREAGVAGQEGLDDLAAAWQVSVRTGASLVEALDAAADRLAADAEVARVVEAELAATRLAGRVMACLPLAGLVLGYGLGGDPIAFLVASPVGWVCLNAGVGLACAGVLWIDTVASRAGGR